ncbi:hypothetical protein [Nostoc sp. 106C]|uniref:hypothetical protein n=1 Tax=Nostoc sp. 106C TaxID=1932667 RepID=UPI000A3C55FF|nr:hypothetical protein [Nostoc sp. 106C]OUL32923.1 hypothetical protein BV375_08530 [Nostoc sp. 106C]
MTDLEDLIPLPICVEAARRHAREVYGATDKDVALIKEDTVLKKITTGETIFDAIEAYFQEKLISKEIYIDKISLSRSVIHLINILNLSRKNGEKENRLFRELEIFEINFKFLFKYLNDKIRKAKEKLTDESISDRVERYKRRFFRDNPLSTRREDARNLLVTIEDLLLEETDETEIIKKQIQNLRHTYQLEKDMYKIIERDDYAEFKKGLEKIKYAGRVVSQENKFNQ